MRLKHILSFSLLLFGIYACSTPAYDNLNVSYTTNRENLNTDNANLTKKLSDKIKAIYPDAQIKIDANDFNVLILGQVKSSKIKDRITDLAENERNVKDVWNYLTVNPRPHFAINSSLIDKVEARLLLEKNINPQNVMIEAVGGTVYLIGTNIGNLTYFDRAIRGIYSLEGVDTVINLTIPGSEDYRSQEDVDF